MLTAILLLAAMAAVSIPGPAFLHGQTTETADGGGGA